MSPAKVLKTISKPEQERRGVSRKGHYARDCWYKNGETANKPKSPSAAKTKAKTKEKKAEKEKPKGKERARGRQWLKSSKSGVTTIWLEVNGTSESEVRVESVLRPLEDLLDKVRKDWIFRSPDNWSWKAETRVRIAELEHRISTDLS